LAWFAVMLTALEASMTPLSKAKSPTMLPGETGIRVVGLYAPEAVHVSPVRANT